jgi:exopolysaccharide biosynthesis polyprenyl glycosylphosphotransferase
VKRLGWGRHAAAGGRVLGGSLVRMTGLLLISLAATRAEDVLRRRRAAATQALADEPSSAIESELASLAHRLGRVEAAASASELAAPHRRYRRSWALRRALLAADVLGCAAALLFVQFAIVHYDPRDVFVDLLMLGGLCGWVVLAQLLGLYEGRATLGSRSGADDLPSILVLSTMATWVGLLVLEGTGFAHPRLANATTFWFGSIAFVTIFRALGRASVQRFVTAREATLILGSGRVAGQIAAKLATRPWHGLQVVGFLDDDPAPFAADAPPYLGRTSKLEAMVGAYGIERVIVAFSRMSTAEQVELSRRCMELDVRIDIVPRMFEVIGSQNRLYDLDGLPLVEIQRARLPRPSRLLKRWVDLGLAGLALALLGPFMVFTAIRIKLESPGPVFFRQERMGAGGRRFEILKFRTMYADAEERKAEVAHLNRHQEDGPRMFKVEDDPRITPFGKFLRRWSLDELPQLFNVIRGEMSLVGPRPLILDEDKNIVGLHRQRLYLLPGITGLWQVLGRSEIPFSEMVTLDYLYVTNWSLWGDLKLLWRTIPVVLARRGAY